MSPDPAWLRAHLRDVVDFPKPGIVFKDISPLFADPVAFRTVIDAIVAAQDGADRFEPPPGLEGVIAIPPEPVPTADAPTSRTTSTTPAPTAPAGCSAPRATSRTARTSRSNCARRTAWRPSDASPAA